MYKKLIIETCLCNDADAIEIEEYMREIIFHSTLDWQSKKQLQTAAKQAWNDIQFMRSDEGKKYLETLKY